MEVAVANPIGAGGAKFKINHNHSTFSYVRPRLRVSYARTFCKKMIALSDIKILRDKYLEIIRLEVEELGCKPTEVRHLIGRLGEFYCALAVKGQLAHTANQHGFDVISESGRRISVKTSAQADRGFFIISNKTMNKVDDLMLLQYKDGNIIELYYGDAKKAVTHARYYEDKDRYNLDLSKAKKIK